MKAPAFGHAGPPTAAIETRATPAEKNEGKALYHTFCFACHGVEAVASTLPDLRYATAETHKHFEAIVLRGELAPAGMPSFGDLLSPAEVRAIQAYILSRAAESTK